MNEISYAPQSRVIKPSTAPGGVRTPRLYNRDMKNKYIQPSNSRNLPTFPLNGESNQTVLLKTLYNTLIEIVNKLLAHNNATISFRNSISAQVQENQRLFGAFLQSAIKQFGTSPVLQRGAKPGDVASNGLQQTAIPFLKSWKVFAKSLIDIQNTGPQAIRHTITQNFDLISTALENVSQFMSSGKAMIHNAPSRNILQMIKQNSILKEDVLKIIGDSNELEQLKTMANKVKAFSRLVNDCFAQEISNFNIPTNEIVRIRQRTYTACCDIISALKGAYLFELDMNALLNTLDELQDCMTIMLERLDLPTSYIYRREIHDSKDNFEIERYIDFGEEEEIDFATAFTLPSPLAQYSLNNIQTIFNNGEKLTKLLTVVKNLSETIEDENTAIKQQLKDLEHDNQEILETTRKETQTNQDKVKKYEEEILRLRNIIDSQEDEISQLRNRQTDNEFKQALRNVARKLGGVIQEEEVNFQPDDDDDDQLISKVDALTVYVVERKCQKCLLHKEQEEEMRRILSVIVDPDDVNMKFIDIVREVVQRYKEEENKIEELKQKISSLNGEKEFLIGGFKEILQFYKRPIPDAANIYDEAINAAMDYSNDLKRQLDNLAKTKEEELYDFARNISAKFNDYAEINNLKGTPVQQTVIITDSALQSMAKIKAEIAATKKLFEKIVKKLSTFLNYKVETDDVDKMIDEMMGAFDRWENPLKKPLFESETQNKFLITSIEVINNRFRGVSAAEQKKLTNKLSPQNLVNQTIKMLEQFQDEVESRSTELIATKQARQDLRRALEKVDYLAHSFIGMEDIDLSTLRDEELCSRCIEFMEKITALQANPQFLSSSELNDMFVNVYDLVPVTTRSDPRKYIPEVNAAFMSLNNTIIALKPFASVLNEIFTTFDCKFSSYIPGSDSCKQLRQQVMKLHSALSAIQPSKINSFVFLIVSRFIALLSSFLSALTAFSYSDTDEQAKSFLYALQQENEKLNVQIEQMKASKST